jgi:hypothetical protein
VKWMPHCRSYQGTRNSSWSDLCLLASHWIVNRLGNTDRPPPATERGRQHSRTDSPIIKVGCHRRGEESRGDAPGAVNLQLLTVRQETMAGRFTERGKVALWARPKDSCPSRGAPKGPHSEDSPVREREPQTRAVPDGPKQRGSGWEECLF